jgi:predicted Rossmann fold nucleotide-binding protein DprA/Smf involved in DNA uptake
MDIVVKLVIDHETMGDVYVRLYDVPKKFMNTYPVADDALHVIEQPKLLPPPKEKKKKSKTRAKRGDVKRVILEAIKPTPTAIKDIIAEATAAGVAKQSMYAIISKLVQAGQVRRVNQGVYKREAA